MNLRLAKTLSVTILYVASLLSCSNNIQNNNYNYNQITPITENSKYFPSFKKSDFPNNDFDILQKQNFSLQKSLLNLENSRLEYQKSFDILLPKIDSAIGVTKMDNDNSNISENQNMIQANLSYNIDLFGRLSALRDVANNNYNAEIYDHKALILAIYSSYLQNFGQLVYSKQYVSIAKQQKQLAYDNLRLATIRYNAGTIVINDKLTAQSKYKLAKTNYLKSREAYLSASQSYNLLLGKSDLKTSENISFPKIPNIPNDIYIDLKNLDNRPDIMAKKYKLNAAISNKDFALANLYPNISLSLNVQNIASDISNILTKEQFLSSISTVISQNLFDGGIKYKDIDISNNKLQIAQIDYKDSIISAISQLDFLQERFLRAKLVLQNAKISAKLAEKNFLFSNNSYQNGVINLRDLLSAQDDYQSANILLLQAKKNLYDIYGLWLIALAVNPIE